MPDPEARSVPSGDSEEVRAGGRLNAAAWIIAPANQAVRSQRSVRPNQSNRRSGASMATSKPARSRPTTGACIGPGTGGRPWVDAWAARPAAGRYGVTVTTENMPALKWPGMLQTKR